MRNNVAMTSRTALSNRQVLRAAVIVLLGFLASGVLGLVRVGVLANVFGTSAAYDAFIAAQRIPEIIFVLVAGGALGSSFIPVYAKQRSDDANTAWRFASAVMTITCGLAILISLIVALFAPWLVRNFLLPDSSPQLQELTTQLTRVMMLTPGIFAISGLVMGILQSHQSFILPSLAISMNNIGIIIGAILIAPALVPHPDIGQVGNANVFGLAIGAILSALLHLLVQLPGLYKLRARLRPSLNWRLDGVSEVLRLMGPRVLGVAVVQVNFVVNIRLASPMVEGSLSALTTAFTIMFFALGIIGQSVGSAVFPTLAAMVAEEDYDGYKNRLSNAIRTVLFLSLPATAVFIILGQPLVSIFQRGEWTPESTAATAWALAFYAIGIAGFALLEVLSRAFYALHDTWTPVIAGIGAMIANIILSILFVQFIGDPESLERGPFAGLALANALTTLVEALVLWYLLRRRIHTKGEIAGLNDAYILQGVGKTAIATIVMCIGIWIVITALPNLMGVSLLLVAGVIGAVLFFVMGILLRIDETTTMLRLITSKLRLR